MTTGYFSHPDCLSHDMGAGHPECPARIHAIEDHLRAVGLDMLMLPQDVPMASNRDLALAHDLNYVLTRITLPGSIYLGLIALLPLIALATVGANQNFPFGGASILIIVGVGLETVKQIDAQLQQRHYEGLLR